MVRLALHSIAYEAKTLNLAKAGYTAFYVDDATGSDAHDGGSWGQAFKTIQYAIDESSAWAKIFISAGTYAEEVTIGKDNIQLLAAKQWVTIQPGSGKKPLIISSDQCVIENIFADAGPSPTNAGAIEITGDLNKLNNCKVSNGGSQQGVRIAGDKNRVYNLQTTDTIGTVIHLIGSENVFERSRFTGLAVSDLGFAIQSGSNKNRIFDCELENFDKVGAIAIKFFSGCSNNVIYHNNLISNDTDINDGGTNTFVSENYYSSHTTDTNNDGLCDTPYTFTGGADYQPVSRRNGWKQESLGNTLSKNVSMMEFWSDMDVSVGLTTSTANLPLPDVVVADIPSGATIVRVIGMINIREIFNTSGSGANALTAAAVINVKKSTGAWGTDDVALINFPDNSWNVSASTRRAARMFVGDNNASSEVDENATYNLRFNGNVFVDYFTLGLVDVAVGLRVYFTS